MEQQLRRRLRSSLPQAIHFHKEDGQEHYLRMFVFVIKSMMNFCKFFLLCLMVCFIIASACVQENVALAEQLSLIEDKIAIAEAERQ